MTFALSTIVVPSDEGLRVTETISAFAGAPPITAGSIAPVPVDEIVEAASAVDGSSLGSSPVINPVAGGSPGVIHRWTYLFVDLVTGTFLGRVPLAGVTFSSVLNGAGQLSAKLLLADPKVAKALRGIGGGMGGLLQTGRTAIYVDLDGEVVWGGILWAVPTYDASTTSGSASHEVTLTAAEFWSYYTQRYITWDTATYTAVDQFAVVEDLFYTAQAMPGGNIGLTGIGYLSGVKVTVAFDPAQMTSVDRAVNTIATQAGSAGFDYAIDVSYDVNKYPVRQLTLSYPRRGRLASPTSPVFNLAEQASLGFTYARDSTQQANSVYGIGAGSGPASTLRSAQEYLPNITAGWPLLEAPLQRSDVTDQPTLEGVTRTFLAGRTKPVETFTVNVSIDSPVVPFGSYGIGDDCRLIIPQEPFFPGGVDKYLRITGWTVTPGDDGVGMVAVTIQAPPVVGAGAETPPRTYPSSLAPGVSLAHAYDGVNQTYNLGAWSRWPAAQYRAQISQGSARLNMVGDASVFGAANNLPSTASPPAALAALSAPIYSDGGSGIQLFIAPGFPAAPDARVATAGFTLSPTGPAGAGMVGYAGADFYLTPGIPFGSYTLWYWGQPGGGAFTYEILQPGGSPGTVTVNTNLPSGWYAASNVVDPTISSGLYVNVLYGPVIFGGWEAIVGFGGIRVGRIATPTATAHSLTAHTLGTFSLPGGVADLAVILTAQADYEAQSSTFAADLVTLVSAAQGAGSDVLLVVPPPNRSELAIPQSAYAATIYATADAHDCAVLDLYDRWDPLVISHPDYYRNTTSAPSNAGSADIAAAILAAVR